MSTFSKGQQEQYRMFVIEELISAYKFDKETAINLAHNSVFSKMQPNILILSVTIM